MTSLLEDKSSFCSNDRTLTGMVEVHNKKKIVSMNCQCVCLIFTLAAVHKDFEFCRKRLGCLILALHLITVVASLSISA